MALDLLNQVFYKKNDVLTLIIETTNGCNFKCLYCYQDHETKIIDTTYVENLFSAICDYCSKNTVHEINIEWFGGEPLLGKNQIIEFLKLLNPWCEANGIRYAYKATTNGYYLTKETFVQFYKLGFRAFSITIDGFKETHEKYRINKTGKGSWDTISKNLKDIDDLSLDCIINIRANYNYEILAYIDEYTEYLKSTYTSPHMTFCFYPIKRWGGENDSMVDIVDPDLYQDTTNIIINQFSQKELRGDYFTQMTDLLSNICYAAKPGTFYIDVLGNIRKCTLPETLSESLAVIGNINSGKFDFNRDINTVYCTPNYAKLYENGCFECSYLPLCYGMTCPKADIMCGEIKCIAKLVDFKELLTYEYNYKKTKKHSPSISTPNI